MDNGGVLHVHKHIFQFHFHPSLSPIISLQKTMLDPKTEAANINLHTFNPLEPINGSYGAVNFGSKPQKAAQNYEKYRNWNGGLQFRPENIGEDESGVCSPPLWGNKSPSRSPIHSPKSGGDNYFPHGLSPSSRVQAIARGQLELMEMVKAMPESSYELSLKDLVEYHSHRVEIQNQNQEECLVEEESLSNKASHVKRQESAKKIEKKVKMVRSGSNINENNKGLFLKMVFPITLGGKKKKKKANPYAKVSPKPDGINNSDNKASKVVEKEWWKKRLTSISDESESCGISSNSGSTGSSGSSGSSVSSRSTRSSSTRRKKKGCLRGFLPFYSKKSLPAK